MSSSEFYWDDKIVIKVCGEFSAPIDTLPLKYLQVEDRLFSVPRSEFIESSKVFADMFRLPSQAGPGANPDGQDGANPEGQDGANTEGQDREHPIVLEGCKKDEFACLLKVLYPTYVVIIFIKLHPTYLYACRVGSLISGTTFALSLRQGEWVSVLKLSTIWNMEKV